MSAISRSAGATADRLSVSACRQALQQVDEAIDVLVRLVHEVAHLLAAVRLQRACQHAGQCLETFSSGVCTGTPALPSAASDTLPAGRGSGATCRSVVTR